MGASGGAAAVGPTRIGQVALTVEDVERATAFYRDVVGLEFLFDAPPGLAFLRCGEVRLMLSRPERRDGSVMPPAAPSTILYYAVDDVDEAHRRIEAGGAEVLGTPRVVHRTGDEELWIGFYRDPEGNAFATMEERPRAGGGDAPDGA